MFAVMVQHGHCRPKIPRTAQIQIEHISSFLRRELCSWIRAHPTTELACLSPEVAIIVCVVDDGFFGHGRYVGFQIDIDILYLDSYSPKVVSTLKRQELFVGGIFIN